MGAEQREAPHSLGLPGLPTRGSSKWRHVTSVGRVGGWRRECGGAGDVFNKAESRAHGARRVPGLPCRFGPCHHAVPATAQDEPTPLKQPPAKPRHHARATPARGFGVRRFLWSLAWVAASFPLSGCVTYSLKRSGPPKVPIGDWNPATVIKTTFAAKITYAKHGRSDAKSKPAPAKSKVAAAAPPKKSWWRPSAPARTATPIHAGADGGGSFDYSGIIRVIGTKGGGGGDGGRPAASGGASGGGIVSTSAGFVTRGTVGVAKGAYVVSRGLVNQTAGVVGGAFGGGGASPGTSCPPAANGGGYMVTARPGQTGPGGIAWPVIGRVSRGFNPGTNHKGIDICAPTGTPVYASRTGRVAYAGNRLSGFGNVIMLEHGGGVATVYGHQSRNLVCTGDWVRTGQQIGEVGMTGRASAPHCHFEVRYSTRAIDPKPYLP